MHCTPLPPRSSVRERVLGSCRLAAAVGTLLCSTLGAATAQVSAELCGNPFVNHFGPYDYRTAPAATKHLVEHVHFTIGVETLTKPATTMFVTIAQDIGYTLQVFPNHPRALISIQKAAERFRRDPPPGTTISVECFFDRAIRYRPDDTVVRALFAQFLGKRKRLDEARRQLRIAAQTAAENPVSTYNLGLVALELGLHDVALQQAHRALGLGFPRAELRAGLEKVGQWQEPPPPDAMPAASAPQPAASAASR